MTLLGLISEPPFDPLSWSGSSANFFRSLQKQGALANAREVSLSEIRDSLEKVRTLSLPMRRWKEQYHASVPRFRALTEAAGRIIGTHRDVNGILQIGAWFSAGATTNLPCFSYHDGNAALWYRYYGRGLLSEGARRAHLRWEQSVYTALTGIFVMSEWLADSFINDFGVARSKVHVVGAGINIEKLPQIPERSWSTPRYLLVGRDFERKGGKYLLEAFKIVRKAIPDAELIVAGPAHILEQPGVTCAGYLSKSKPEDRARLDQLFNSVTAMVLPSIYEPFGISLLEGMAYGLPCIAVDRCAMPEIVRQSETGLIARAEDATSLANAMIEVGRNPRDAARLGAAGRRRVESDYTWTAVTAKIKSTLSVTYGM
ncbi:MAG TPA: glycosyltransferase family 4 protein [Steroidobacteraceae bacterium]|jgi:glycosyltransferase involved in cell wall biosynthesis